MDGFEEILGDGRRLAAACATQELVLTFLRERGLDKIDSIKAVRVIYEIPFSKAKELVDLSETWSDRYEHDMEFRRMAIRALRDLASEFHIQFEDLPDPPK
jgi:hypothetical protein